MTKCDICGELLTKEEEVIFNDILSDNTPCYCSIVKIIAKLQDDTFIRMSPVLLKEFKEFMKSKNKVFEKLEKLK